MDAPCLETIRSKRARDDKAKLGVTYATHSNYGEASLTGQHKRLELDPLSQAHGDGVDSDSDDYLPC